MKKVISWLVVAIFTISTISSISVYVYINQYLNKEANLDEGVIFLVESGSSPQKIANSLYEQSIISNPSLFVKISKFRHFRDKQFSFKFGEYYLKPNISVNEILTLLSEGKTYKRKLTIPEGLTIQQITKIINNTNIITGAINPHNIAEGSLLPDTYFYTYGVTAHDLVTQMQNNMQKTLDELWEERQENLPIKTKQEALILASIIEKETGRKNERKRVAAVFINRLNKGMRLQTDPTVIYAVTNGYGKLNRPIYKKDLRINSPYNTYRIYGLPPTPIANPGRAAIEAALNPIKSNELYFVADGNGGHKFSTNLLMHNKNVSLFRQLQKERKQDN